MSDRTGPALRIAHLANFAPRKLGTGEDRLVFLAQETHCRGHKLAVYCHEPVHDSVRREVEACAASIKPLTGLSQGPVLRTARRLAKRHDVIVLNMLPPRGRVAIASYLAWPSRVLFVDHVSGPALEENYESRPWILRAADRLTMFRVSSAAGVSRYVEQRLQRRFSLPPERTATLYGGVDTRRFRGAAGDGGGKIRLAVVAALIPEKGVDVLLEALACGIDADWSLDIAGDGPDAGRLEALARDRGLLDRVAFLGLRDDVDAVLRNADVFVHPATWNEALGYTILEGMASGCAVVASRIGAIPELIEHGKNGLLFSPGSADELRDRLRELCKDPGMRLRLAAASRRTIEERFDLRANVSGYVDWIEANS